MKRSIIFVFLMLILAACTQSGQNLSETIPPTANLGEGAEENSTQPLIYVVKAGDSLVGIASSFGVTKDELIAANPGFDGFSLVIGQELIIPAHASSQPTTEGNGSAEADCAKIAFVLSVGQSIDIFSVRPDGSDLMKLTNGESRNFQPAWSPDGKRIAFVSSRSGSNQIYIMDEDGQNLQQVTWEDDNGHPIWLPGGTQIAFRTMDGEGLWWWQVIDLVTNQVSQFSEPSFDFFFQTPAWSPDGQYIAYMSLAEQSERNNGSSQIHIRSVDGLVDIALTNDTWANITPIWSPDGSKIAFLSERDGTYDMFALYVVEVDGSGLLKLSEPIFAEDTTFTWSPDGAQIAITMDVTVGNIFIFDVDTGTSWPLLDLPQGTTISMPAWQPTNNGD